jgi:4-amino-4-deoxy-L-arabinose transferase-like glycosyltransferase
LLGGWTYASHQLGLAVPVVSRYFPFGWKATNEILPVSFSAQWVLNPTDGLDWVMNSLLTRLPSAIGVYHFPVLLIAGLTALKARKPVDLFLISWIVIIFISILLTLPDHRYFMPAFPAMAILMAGWLKEKPDLNVRYTILSVCFLLSSLVIFIDWDRQTELFIK